jgi:UDPglucose--hexose-1-phosphate uridylyltransferase
VIAPGRARRPGAFLQLIDDPTPDELETCPFCAGREDRTPPQTLVLPEEGAWTVRVVPNLYPALERQEVVVHSPRHVRTLADLSLRELEQVAEAWQARAAAAREQGFAYVHVLVNEGRAAGASLQHSHSQLVWLEDEPPLVDQERRAQEAEGDCVLCRVLADELEHRMRVVSERDGLVLLCPFAGRQPYELLVAPRECEDDPFESGSLGSALGLVAEGIGRIRIAEGPTPVNVWLHAAGHWHLEVLPRLTILAGLELGSGYFVNTLAPESAAGVLRES